ncbi:diguanylate cyclase domain-containing protein [Sphingomonas sp. M1-B02]|uniref:diguanylate cyclase domain-containing protein n=1 Tax=Sphingomonas sp. M1-B02 TaxID=3114300 RepID=UPI003FA68C30
MSIPRSDEERLRSRFVARLGLAHLAFWRLVFRVSRRLAVRSSAAGSAEDVAALVEGDEFVILQKGARQPGEAERLARRIACAIAEPYSIVGHSLLISTSVGYVRYHP